MNQKKKTIFVDHELVICHGHVDVKVMLHETIRNDDSSSTKGCTIIATSFRIVTTLQSCVALKIVVANLPV